MSDEIKVNCAYTEMVEVAKLHPHPKNPNRHPAKQVRLLAKVIEHQGWRAPIIVSKRSGYIIAGHGRLEAAKQLKLASVPVDYQEFATEADEIAHLVADNKLPELSDMDMNALNELIKIDILSADLDIELTGFDQDAFDKISVGPHERKPPTEFPSHDEEIHTDYCCPKCGYKWSGKTA